ncbi:MAG: hypothetical protein PHQ40_08120 [Anaerolineaceae bacterium]|nr:hypothetical protein [Anaerolineaceae bacterium]
MDNGRQALVLLYALFWAAALNATGRYQPFDTSSMFIGESRAWKRFFASLIILNILPIGLLFLLYQMIPSETNWPSIIAAAVASLSVFGFHRILHAVVASEKYFCHFFTEIQVEEVRKRGEFKQPQTFWAHFLPGILYIFIPMGLAWLITLFPVAK